MSGWAGAEATGGAEHHAATSAIIVERRHLCGGFRYPTPLNTKTQITGLMESPLREPGLFFRVARLQGDESDSLVEALGAGERDLTAKENHDE